MRRALSIFKFSLHLKRDLLEASFFAQSTISELSSPILIDSARQGGSVVLVAADTKNDKDIRSGHLSWKSLRYYQMLKILWDLNPGPKG